MSASKITFITKEAIKAYKIVNSLTNGQMSAAVTLYYCTAHISKYKKLNLANALGIAYQSIKKCISFGLVPDPKNVIWFFVPGSVHLLMQAALNIAFALRIYDAPLSFEAFMASRKVHPAISALAVGSRIVSASALGKSTQVIDEMVDFESREEDEFVIIETPSSPAVKKTSTPVICPDYFGG